MDEKKERKTETLLDADKMIHLYQREQPQKVYVVGQVRSYENGEGENKRYVQEFYGSYTPPKDDGSPDNRKRSLFRAETTQPIQDLNEFSGKDQMLMVSGQTYSVAGKNKDGENINFRKTFVRSIKTTKLEEREVNGEKRNVIVGDKDLMPASIATKREFYAANNRNLSGFINGTKLNQEMKNKAGEVFAYRQFMYVGKNKKETPVVFYTKDPVDPADFEKNKRISMPGAMHVVSQRGEDGKFTHKEVFEPNYIGQYLSKEKDQKVEQEAPAVKQPEIQFDLPDLDELLDNKENKEDFYQDFSL